MELIGLPGSGKTATSVRATDDIVREDTEQSEAVSGFGRRGGWRIRISHIVRHPVVGVLAYLMVASRRGVRRRNLLRVLGVQNAFRRLLSVRRQPAVVDEGPVHALYVAMFGTDESRASAVLLKSLLWVLARNVRAYLFLDVPAEACVTNFLSRDGISRFQRGSSDDLVAQFRADQTYSEIVAALRSVAPTKLLIAPDVTSAVHVLRTILR